MQSPQLLVEMAAELGDMHLPNEILVTIEGLLPTAQPGRAPPTRTQYRRPNPTTSSRSRVE